jgi:hypothetical protein
MKKQIKFDLVTRNRFIQIFIVVFLIIFTFSIRLSHLKREIVDYQSWRQSDTYVMTKKIYYGDSNLFKPRINQIIPETNLNGIFIAEFPLYQFFLAILFKLFGVNIIIARLFTIFITCLTTLSIYYIGKKLFSATTGVLSAMIFNLFPFSFYWGRAISPDNLALFFSSLSIALILKKNIFRTFLSFIFLGLATLIKPFFIVLLLPMIYFVIVNRQINKHRYLVILILLTLSMIPYILRYLYRSFIPEALLFPYSIVGYISGKLPIWQFLKNTQWLKILFVNRLPYLLTPLGNILFIGSIFTIISMSLNKNAKVFIYLWLSSSFLAVVIVAQGNLSHDYYQLILLPIISIFIGVLINYNLKKLKRISLLNISISVIFLLTTYFLGIIPFFSTKIDYFRQEIRYYRFLPDIINSRKLINATSKVIVEDNTTPTGPFANSPSLLNQIDHHGWIIPSAMICNIENDPTILKRYKNMGASILILTLEPYYNYGEVEQCQNKQKVLRYFKNHLKIIYHGNSLAVFSL